MPRLKLSKTEENPMEASTVYYTDFRCPVGTSLTEKLRRLCIAAGIKSIDMDGKFVAIKMHFGELGNLAFLRPNYAKVVADLCRCLPERTAPAQQSAGPEPCKARLELPPRQLQGFQPQCRVEGNAGAGRKDRHGHPPVHPEEDLNIKISPTTSGLFLCLLHSGADGTINTRWKPGPVRQ